jgi:hypothetical protein
MALNAAMLMKAVGEAVSAEMAVLMILLEVCRREGRVRLVSLLVPQQLEVTTPPHGFSCPFGH